MQFIYIKRKERRVSMLCCARLEVVGRWSQLSSAQVWYVVKQTWEWEREWWWCSNIFSCYCNWPNFRRYCRPLLSIYFHGPACCLL